MTDKGTSPRHSIKCLFVGLEFSGKTSIISILERKFAEIFKLKPTKGMAMTDFSLLRLPIKLWDMGGQKGYRNDYLSTSRDFFDSTNLLFYVIDVQDQSKFAETIEYYQNILKVLELRNLDPRILIILHKCDPDMKSEPQTLKNVRELKKRLSEIPTALNASIHETNIYEPIPIQSLFVQEILKLLPRGGFIQELLTKFMKGIGANAVSLIDNNILTIADAYTEKNGKKICEICGSHFASMSKELQKDNFSVPEAIQFNMGSWVGYRHVKYLDTGFDLVFHTKSDKLDKVNEKLPAFTKELFDIFEYIM